MINWATIRFSFKGNFSAFFFYKFLRGRDFGAGSKFLNLVRVILGVVRKHLRNSEWCGR